jgi:hypothetical protein
LKITNLSKEEEYLNYEDIDYTDSEEERDEEEGCCSFL